MSETQSRDGRASPEADASGSPAPITVMLSSRLMVLANLLKRGAILRYKRLAGVSSVEFGLVASLGRRPPMSVARLAEAVGQDKGQISRALAELVARKLIVAGAQERNRQLLEHLGTDEFETLLAQIDRLTSTAEKMLEAEKVLR
jgi:DNA-binding MarR family transcriptional regulator